MMTVPTNQQGGGTLLADDEQPFPFPLLADSPRLPETVGQGDAATIPRKPRVLVVDDEQNVADTLKLILINAGFEARAAYSGEMAIGLLRDFQPDMLITDVIMPGISGIQAAIHVCAILPSCKVLLISGNDAAAGLLEAAIGQGREFEILAKPFHPTELLTKMRSALSDCNPQA